MDGPVAVVELAAVQRKGQPAQPELARRGHRRRHPAEDVVDPEHEFLRLEWLGQVIVGAALQAADPVLGLGHGGQHQDRHLARSPQRPGEVEAALARHHQVEDNEIEGGAGELAPRVGSVAGGGDDEAVLGEVAGEQLAQLAVVVHHQDVRRGLHHDADRLDLVKALAILRVDHCPEHVPKTLRRPRPGSLKRGVKALRLGLAQHPLHGHRLVAEV